MNSNVCKLKNVIEEVREYQNGMQNTTEKLRTEQLPLIYPWMMFQEPL